MNIQEKLAYTAGIVDGEGTFGCYKAKNGQKWQYMRLQITVSQKELPLLLWLKKTWGGNVYTEKPRMRWGKMYEPCSFWYLYHSKAVDLAKLLQPYLIVKKEQVKKVLQPFTK